MDAKRNRENNQLLIMLIQKKNMAEVKKRQLITNDILTYSLFLSHFPLLSLSLSVQFV